MLSFHAAGKWSRGQVSSVSAPSSWRSNGDIDRLIEAEWERAGKRPGVRLFDGPMCRLESWTADAARLELRLSQTSYKIFLGTNLAHAELAKKFGREVMANPVGLSTALLTADNKLVMGRRNSNVAYYPDRVHPFAGALEPKDGTDVFAGALRELDEELGLPEAEITSIDCIGLAEDRSIGQPELFFAARTTRTEKQLAAAMDTEEHRGMWAIEATQAGIEEAVRDQAMLTPVGVASLLLWGRIAWGDAWFEDARSRLSFT